MRILEMTQVGRYYYDPRRPVPIPQHKLELWPGYITAIEHYEGKCYGKKPPLICKCIPFLLVIYILLPNVKINSPIQSTVLDAILRWQNNTY